MASLMNYFKDIEFFIKQNKSIEHSNEFSIKSEDYDYDYDYDFKKSQCKTCKISKSRVKFYEVNEKLEKDVNDQSSLSGLLEYFYSILNKVNMSNYCQIPSIVFTIIIILIMTLKIVFNNLIFV